MKVIIEIDDYILDTDIDSNWVNVCNDELAESLNNAVKLSDVLQEIKKEIELKEKTLTDKYGQTKYGVWTDDVCNVFDKYIEKYSNT